LQERLEVLSLVEGFAAKLEDPELGVLCPACGREIPVKELQAHIEDEKRKLSKFERSFSDYKEARANLLTALEIIKRGVDEEGVQPWVNEISEEKKLAESVAFSRELPTAMPLELCGEDNLREIERRLVPLIEAASSAAEDMPPDVQRLHHDLKIVEFAARWLATVEDVKAVESAERLGCGSFQTGDSWLRPA